jgi:hypothetical protein
MDLNMQAASYMLPAEHIKKIEKHARERRITQDEVVRRAVAEYFGRESASPDPRYVPSEIKSSSLHGNRG